MNIKFNKILLMPLCTALIFSACKKDDKKDDDSPEITSDIPEFYNSNGFTPKLTVIANSSEKVNDAWDIDFNPLRTNELWILNKGTTNTGSSTVMLTNAGTDQQTFDLRKDQNSWHFMALSPALAFSEENGNWATVEDILDANRQGGSFTGPALWSSNLSVYARPSGGNGSHLDMLHGSPYSMGIENDYGNSFWIVDGHHGYIVWYDFAHDHGPGNSNHDDGKIHRYTNVKIKRKAGVASHMVMDKKTGWLYIADPGNNRIIRMNTVKSKRIKVKNLPLTNERLAEHFEMSAEWEVFTTEGFTSPCGIEFKDGRLYVSDNDNGDIIAYSVDTKKEIGRLKTGNAGVKGIVIGPNNKLWYTNSIKNEVVRIDPK